MSVSRMILVAMPSLHDFCRSGNVFRPRKERSVSDTSGKTAFPPCDTLSYMIDWASTPRAKPAVRPDGPNRSHRTHMPGEGVPAFPGRVGRPEKGAMPWDLRTGIPGGGPA